MATVPLTPTPPLPAGRPRTAGAAPSSQAGPAGEWLFGPYHLLPASARLRAGERSHELDPRALSVLECLLRHAGEVVPRAILIAEAWPDVETVLDSTVSKAMRRLRLALGDGGGHVLQTVYGEGYRLALPATWLPSAVPAMHARQAAPAQGATAAGVAAAGPAAGLDGALPGPRAAGPDASNGLETASRPARAGTHRSRNWLAWLPWAVATLALLLAAWLGWLLMRAAGAPT